MGAPLEGELTFAQMSALLPRIDALSATQALSLRGVTRTDSAGLAFLLELTRRARARGIELSIRDAPLQVIDLARFFGLDSILRFDNNAAP